MLTQLKIISPSIAKGLRSIEEFKSMMRPDLEIEHTMIDLGPPSIESEFDEALCIPDVMKKAVEAEQSGANAIIIDCMGDPGLKACREAVSIPVVGPAETAMHMASMLGHRFSFVTVLSSMRLMIDNLVAGYELKDSYAAFAAIDIPVLELHDNLDNVIIELTNKSIETVKQDGAGAIVLGCTGFLGCAASIRQGLLEEGLDVPVIDPIPLAVHTADALVKTGLSHSKYMYPTPRKKDVVGFTVPGFCEG